MSKEYVIKFPMPDAYQVLLRKDDYLFTLLEVMETNGKGIPNSRKIPDIYVEVIQQFYKDIYKTDGGAVLMEALIDAYKTNSFKLAGSKRFKDYFTLQFE